MLKRFERPLRIVCMVLGALVLFQIGRVIFRSNPLDKLEIPQLPTFSTNVQNKASSTNLVVARGLESTNSKPLVETEKKSTNASAASTEKATNGVVKKTSATNEANVFSISETKNTNALTTGGKGTNVVAQTNGETNKTNSAVLKEDEKKATHTELSKSPPRGMPSFPGAPGGKKPVALPPAIQARVDKITQSEILASVVRPLPMALLGIAGNSAFLRTSTGQSGVVNEGDELGGLKLLKIGINRVLVEENGEKKELMVFSGFGSESLLPKEKEQQETPK